MNKKSWIQFTAHAAAIATLAAPVAAQTLSVTLSGGAPGNAQRWGSSLTLFGTVSGPCSGTTTGAGVTATVLRSTGPMIVPGQAFNGIIPCSGGAFTWPFTISPSWIELDSDWQSFRASGFNNLAPAAQVSALSNVLSLRFDPEFVFPFGITATLATADATYGSCDGRFVQQVEREAIGAPPPPPNFRTPVEVFRVLASRCTANAPTLLNMKVTPGFAGTLIYDRQSGPAAWREPVAPFCGPTPTSPCFGSFDYRRFDRSMNTAIYGDVTGVDAYLAFWSPQYDVRGYDVQDMWWAGPSESGWGLNIAKNGEKLFITGFIYDAEGKPMWVYMPSGQWDTRTMVWYGDLYSPHGSRYDAYDPTFLRLGAPIGTGSISFTDTENGHFDYTIDGRSGGKAIGRYHFAPPQEAPGKYTGIYWGGPDQGGWGVSVSHQANTVFATWYTYDIDQKATWFFMPAGQQTAPGVFSGELYRATGAPWAGQHYSAESTKVTRAGTLELRFGNDKPGTLSAVVDGNVIAMTLIPFDF